MTKKEREEKMLARAKKRALSTAMMRELRSEYSEAPEEYRDDLNVHRLKQSKQDKHKVDYEEDNFKRLALTKEDKVCESLILSRDNTIEADSKRQLCNGNHGDYDVMLFVLVDRDGVMCI